MVAVAAIMRMVPVCVVSPVDTLMPMEVRHVVVVPVRAVHARAVVLRLVDAVVAVKVREVVLIRVHGAGVGAVDAVLDVLLPMLDGMRWNRAHIVEWVMVRMWERLRRLVRRLCIYVFGAPPRRRSSS